MPRAEVSDRDHAIAEIDDGVVAPAPRRTQRGDGAIDFTGIRPVLHRIPIVLTATLLLFLIGGVAGLLIGNRLGGYALVVPAAGCLAVAVASVLHSRGRRTSLDRAKPELMQANSG